MTLLTNHRNTKFMSALLIFINDQSEDSIGLKNESEI